MRSPPERTSRTSHSRIQTRRASGATARPTISQIGRVSDLYANPSDETRARQVETWSSGVADPRIDIVPSGFDAVPGTKIGVTLPVFHEVNRYEIGARADDGFTPYSHRPKP